MHKRNYEALARIAGETLAAAHSIGGEDGRTRIYDAMYRPLTAHLAAENSNFDELRFSFATAKSEVATVERWKAGV